MILFIDNGANHILYEKLILKLLERRISAGILYFSRYKYDNSPLPSEYRFIIDIRNKLDDTDIIEAKRRVSLMENAGPDFRFSECIAVDRILSKSEYDKSSQFLLNFTFHFVRLLESKPITCILGEISWGLELLAYNLATSHGIRYANPLNIYAFNKPRLTFFDHRNSIRYIKQISEANSYPEREFESALSGREKNDINKGLGTQLRKSGFKKSIERLKHFVANLRSEDYRYRLSFKKARIYFAGNKRLLNIFGRFIWTSDIPSDSKLVLFPLHVQPEATPDIVAHQFSNQLELARQIASSLPLGTKLLIKEHPNAVGCRSMIALSKFGQLPNTVLISPTYDMQQLMSKTSVVVSIAGTAAMEAALIGIPAIVMSDIYFSDFHGITRVHGYNELRTVLHKALFNGPCAEYKSRNRLNYQMLYNGSYDCFIHHPLIINSVLEEDNLLSLATSIESFYNTTSNNP